MKSNALIAGFVALGLVVPVFGQEVKKPEPPKAEAKKEAPKKEPAKKEEVKKEPKKEEAKK